MVPNDPGTCTAIVHYTVVTTDYCGFTVTQPVGLASGEAFPVGTTGNTFTVSDPTGNEASCSFTVQVQKTADASFLYAYTILGVDDVLLKNNRIQSGGLGLVNANKKARLQAGTTVTGPLSFVKAPILELQGGSQVTTYYNGGTGTGLLPVFQPNGTNANNNLNIPDNSAPVVLSSGSYGNVIIGLHATVTFSGYSTVRIKELTIHNGAKILFAQPTELLIKKGMVIAKNVGFNAGEPVTVQCFAAENVTVDQGSEVSASIYTLKDLLLSKASATVPTRMTGLFIAKNVSAQDFVYWNRSESCPANNIVEQADLSEDRSIAPSDAFGHLQISPNPASEEAQVVFHLEAATTVKLQLLDAAGRLVWTEQISGLPGKNQHRLRLGAVREGVYIVQVLAQGQRALEKLVVLRP